MSWRAFFNTDHSIYVSDRHRLLHDDLIARGLVKQILSATARVLDYGCGKASAAALVAQRCGTLFLYDAAPRVQDALRSAFADNPKIEILTEAGLAALPDGSLDLVTIVSVAQYLDESELGAIADLAHDKLKPGGRLLVADVIPPDLSPIEDARALLAFGWQGGFLFAALSGLVRTFFSDYRALRAENPLTTYDDADMRELLTAHGFAAVRAPENIGHNQARMTFVGTRG